jgi:hypothetical protein
LLDPAPFSRVILLSMAAPSRYTSPPQITLPHVAHKTDSSCRGGQSSSRRFNCCHSTHRLCLCFCRAYSLHAIHSFLLPPVSPVVDSSATNPSHDQPCSTSSHRRCQPPAGHTAASPPRLDTSITGAPIPLHHRFHVSLSAIASFVSLPVTSSQRLPSSPPLIPARTQFVPHSFSKSYYSASQFPLALTL